MGGEEGRRGRKRERQRKTNYESWKIIKIGQECPGKLRVLFKLGLFWQTSSKLFLTHTGKANDLVFTKNKVRFAFLAYISQ